MPDTGTISVDNGENSRGLALDEQLAEFPRANEVLKNLQAKKRKARVENEALYQEFRSVTEQRAELQRDRGRLVRLKGQPGVNFPDADEQIARKDRQIEKLSEEIRELDAKRNPKAPNLTREEARRKEITDEFSP